MDLLIKNPIFDGITEDDIEKMMHCFQAEKKSYHEKDVIMHYTYANDVVGILIGGSISLNRIQADGSMDMLEYISEIGLFGSIFTVFSQEDDFMVQCEKDCKVLFIQKHHLTKRCSNACPHHSMVVENLLTIMSEKVMNLTEKVDVLSHRSIREKLLCYFRTQQNRSKEKSFKLPFSYSSLANYLCVDRSAMMRELKKMREEELIVVNGKEIAVL
ncbi:Crp/Fnr family transcriptional regulator [Chakrabartyella piscis]|uniref:Crp/Fnr family transcriptional regulator n=1 Tax=Chakrabartyella piscis TaxID=2918914 RepID=UPI00295850B1|nr:Crp/Fnr family transcriptional regulator [Chakrabartyella piscis]